MRTNVRCTRYATYKSNPIVLRRVTYEQIYLIRGMVHLNASYLQVPNVDVHSLVIIKKY